MNQRDMLPPADRELLARLLDHPDQAEAARRRRLIEDEPGEIEANQARDAALSRLLGEPRDYIEIERFDRIVRACCWGTLSAAEVAEFQPARSDSVMPEAPPAVKVEKAVPVLQAVPAVPAAAPIAPAPAQIAVQAPTVPAPPPPCTWRAIEFLLAALGAGEQQNRELHAAARKLRLTAKMIRTARERLGVVVERRGFGLDSRAYWRLPNPCPDVPRAAVGIDGANQESTR